MRMTTGTWIFICIGCFAAGILFGYVDCELTHRTILRRWRS